MAPKSPIIRVTREPRAAVVHFTKVMPHDPFPPLLRFDQANLVKNGHPILRDITLQIYEGRHTAILGPNGSGKSSLIKLITSHHYPLARADGRPTVELFGRDRWNVFDLRTLLGIVSSDMHTSFVGGGVLALDAVVSGFFASHGLARNHEVTADMVRSARESLELMEASHLAETRMDRMSTGEARRVLIARALAPDPRALLLDEPTAGLDLVARRRFLETLREVARRGKTILLVTHHVEEIIPEVEHVVLLKEGRVFAEGPKEQMLSEGVLSSLYGTSIDVRAGGCYYTAEMGGDSCQ
jgi:iron complex transport system ATP-binding protein